MKDENISAKPPPNDPVKVQLYNLKRLDYESRKRKLLSDSSKELATKKKKLFDQKRETSRNIALIFKSFSNDFPADKNTSNILTPFLDPCLDNLKNHLQAYAKVFGGYKVSTKETPSTPLFSRGSVVLTLNDVAPSPSPTTNTTVNAFFCAEFRWLSSKQKIVLLKEKDGKLSLKELCFAGLDTNYYYSSSANANATTTKEGSQYVELSWINDLFVFEQKFSEAKIKMLNLLKSKWKAFYELKRQISLLSRLSLPPELKKCPVFMGSWKAGPLTLGCDGAAVYKTNFKKGHFNVEGTVHVTREFPEVPPRWEFAESQVVKKEGISLAPLRSDVNTRFFGESCENVLFRQVALISEALSSINDGLNNAESGCVVGRDRRPSTIIKE